MQAFLIFYLCADPLGGLEYLKRRSFEQTLKFLESRYRQSVTVESNSASL